MFSKVFENIKQGALPNDLESLKKQLDIAVTKKSAVLRLPYHFWSSDPKINPSSEHLAWVCFILEDREIFVDVHAFIAQELLEKMKGKNEQIDHDSICRDTLIKMLERFIHLSPETDFRQILQRKALSCLKSYID